MNKCICRNESRPIDGLRFVSPSCEIHWNYVRFPQNTGDVEAEMDWRAREKKFNEQSPRMVGQRRKAA